MKKNAKFWLLCKVLGHKFKRVKDLRETNTHRERVIYRCLRCEYPLVIRGE